MMDHFNKKHLIPKQEKSEWFVAILIFFFKFFFKCQEILTYYVFRPMFRINMVGKLLVNDTGERPAIGTANVTIDALGLMNLQIIEHHCLHSPIFLELASLWQNL
jgi:hypothetical protein